MFILGSVRSGTSVMINALKDGARLPGYYETNVGPLMQRLIDVVEEYFGNFSPEYLAAKDYHLIASLDPKAIVTLIRNHFAAVFQVKLGSGRWVGKSPDSYLNAPMVRASRHLAEMFPKAKFVFCLRRGIENVLSRQRKFPEVPFGYHCQSWAHTVEEWLKMKPELGDRALEVRQEDIAIRPRTVADALAGFLDLSEKQRDDVVRVFEGPRHEQINLAYEHRPLALEDTPWDESHRADFLRFCLPAMTAAGYSIEGGSSASAASVRLFYPTVPEAARTTNIRSDWGFTEIDSNTFQIHPNEPGEARAEVRWPSTVLKGESQFIADLSLGHRESNPVWFEMRIERSNDGHVCVSNRLELAEVLQWRHCEMTFPPLFGVYDIVLSTQMARQARTSDYAWAQFRDAHLR